jgi:hypothetical protein
VIFCCDINLIDTPHKDYVTKANLTLATLTELEDVQKQAAWLTALQATL